MINLTPARVQGFRFYFRFYFESIAFRFFIFPVFI